MNKIVDRANQPSLKKIHTAKLIKANKTDTHNKIPIYYMNFPGQEVLRMDICIRAGSAYQDKILTASTAMNLLSEGTASYEGKYISETFDFYGAYYENEIDRDIISLKFYSLSKHFVKLLPIIKEIVFNPLFAEEEVDKYLRKSKQKYQINMSKAKYVARQEFIPFIFGDSHPYGTITHIDDFEKISRTDLVDFHQNFYNPANIFILLSGKIEDSLVNILQETFRDSSGSIGPVKEISVNDYNESTVKQKLIERENSVQNAFRIGKRLFNMKHEDYLGMKVLNVVLGGYFGSRLMNNIREDKGYTYGIGSAIIPLHYSGYFFIASEVGTEVCKDALNEVYVELEKLQQEKITAKELELVKNYMLGSFMRAIDGPFEVLERTKTLIEYGLGHAYYDAYVDKINSITPEEIQTLAQKYFDKESMHQLVVGKAF